MPKNFRQYSLTIELARKHSHTTYLASAANEPNRQLVLTVFASWLSHFAHESENVLQKAQRIKDLQHSHLVPILDMGIEQEQPFVVREYWPHGSLRSRMKQIAPDRLELADVLTIMFQVGEALAYAHERDIVHSSIKPENILFDANGQAVLADFYLVSRKDALMRDQTSEEYAFCYLAPEQFASISDAKSDQYALGCLAYELITGRVPFTAQTLASIMGHQSNTLPNPLSESVADLPPSLEAAVLKTLAKDPAERFFDFSLFLDVIESTLSPPPDFSLLHPTYSRKKRTPAYPVQSANTETPIRERRVFELPKPFAVLSDTEGNKVEPTDVLPIADASVPKQTGNLSNSQLLVSVLQSQLFMSSLSQNGVGIRENESPHQPLEGQKPSESSTPFKEEEADASLAIASVSGLSRVSPELPKQAPHC